MPKYTFENTETGEVAVYDMKIAELDPFKAAHPELRRVFERYPIYIDSRKLMGGFVTDSLFNSRLKEIHKNNYGSQMNVGNIGEV